MLKTIEKPRARCASGVGRRGTSGAVRVASRRLLLALVFAACASLARTTAQTVVSPAPPDKTPQTAEARAAEEARAASEKRAFALLEEVAVEAQSLKLVENRVRVQMIIAGLLWEQDAERARSLSKEAQDSLVALIATLDSSDPQYHHTMPLVSQLRHEILGLLSHRDPQAALAFLRATRLPPPAHYSPEYRPPDEELALELNLAGQIVAQDPKQAVRLAEESLSKGVTNGLVGVLQQLRSKDAEAARKLSHAIIQRLRATDFSKDHEAAGVASNLLYMTRSQSAAHTPSASSPATTERLEQMHLLIDEQSRRELIDVAAGAVINGAAGRMNQSLIQSLQGIMPEVEKSAPTRVAALRRKVAESERHVDPRTRMWREHQNVIQNGTLDALVEAAQKAPAEMREQLFAQAAWRAAGQGELERARQLVGHIANPQQRAHMLKEIERQMSMRAIEQGNFAEAQASLSRLTSVEERVPALLNLSRVAAGKEMEKEARIYLEEARTLVEGRAANQMHFSLQLQLAQAYAAIDPSRGFEILEGAIDHLNELIAAAATLNGFGQEAFKDGELRTQGGYMWSELISQCGHSLTALAIADFERARAATERFARLDARLMARLSVAQNMLALHTHTPHKLRGRPHVNTMRRRAAASIELMPATGH